MRPRLVGWAAVSPWPPSIKQHVAIAQFCGPYKLSLLVAED